MNLKQIKKSFEGQKTKIQKSLIFEQTLMTVFNTNIYEVGKDNDKDDNDLNLYYPTKIRITKTRKVTASTSSVL